MDFEEYVDQEKGQDEEGVWTWSTLFAEEGQQNEKRDKVLRELRDGGLGHSSVVARGLHFILGNLRESTNTQSLASNAIEDLTKDGSIPTRNAG
ncbi:hypothetical protein FB45DRAFT_1029157 [Roridomyces roridus]|uniref:Uncharacterized protein n=1 Tax=Roridomyces roridus TaxID=1738132 RepID=A0AAD7BSA3_9AGAR|nr:hypothetical protein FB45DRAFT_1029157 [Roridomyces roridus]